MTIVFSRDECHDTSFMTGREWLEVNGLGGYSSTTLPGCPARKYHGLLVANLPQPASGRHVLLSSVLDSVEADKWGADLTHLRFAGQPLPKSLPTLVRFDMNAWPCWTFESGDLTLTKEILMVRNRDLVLLRYHLLAGGAPAARLRLKPLLAYRRNHHLAEANESISTDIERLPGGFCSRPYTGMPAFYFSVAGGMEVSVRPASVWYRDLYYSVEDERGYPSREDLFLPAAVECELTAGEPVYVAAATEEVENVADVWAAEVEDRTKRRTVRRRRIERTTENPALRDLLSWLMRAGEQFLITAPPQRPTVLAGYHWFEDWGRDAMIALPGLTFACGELAAGFSILRTFAEKAKDGRIPNYIGPEGATPTYNSVDATLWMFWAVQQYLRYGGDHDLVKENLWESMKNGIRHYARVRPPDAYMTDSGLLHCGGPTSQLTWMDAAVKGQPVTPRWGYAVELNALWYNALCLCEELSRTFGDKAFEVPVSCDRLARTFRSTFWLRDDRYLADVVKDGDVDKALRPNQLFAVSLPYSPLTDEMARCVVSVVREKLLTPRGIRTLAPTDSGYRGVCRGGQETRDMAYHQGTVWPWLSGAFWEAYLKVHHYHADATHDVTNNLSGWLDHLREAGIGSVSEIFDGDPPHTPRGCIAQAWSVAELTRLCTLVAGRGDLCEF